jgi:hypothetical protein
MRSWAPLLLSQPGGVLFSEWVTDHNFFSLKCLPDGKILSLRSMADVYIYQIKSISYNIFFVDFGFGDDRFKESGHKNIYRNKEK